MISKVSKKGFGFDFILITSEYYDDHPMSPAGVIARVLDAKGYSVGILEKPQSKEDFLKLGIPVLSFLVTSGSIDSMLNNYTPFMKERWKDKNTKAYRMPDRAVIFFCNKIKEFCKGSKIIIGGVESSLRRFSHYDYWDNNVRRSILLDSRADILVYGNGEKQIIEIAQRLKEKKELRGIEGTCILSRELEEGFKEMPSYEETKDDKIKFSKMQLMLSNSENLAQKYNNNYVLQYKFPRYTTEDLDWIYSLDYSRKLHPSSLLNMGKFSVVTHRGCIGKCSFCSIALHQGDKIISRSSESILKEIEKLTKHPDFKGYIDDLGGPAANMYGMDCPVRCKNSCIECKRLDKSHFKLIALLRDARKIKGIKKIFVRSGIRYDLALESREYIKEISEHHISGCLKIAPEHFSSNVLRLMNKANSRFDEFLEFFTEINKDKKQFLKYYLMIGHPGDNEKELNYMLKRISHLKNVEQFQVFTPTPMTVSTSMYWTGLNPETMQKVDSVRDFRGKKELKRMMLREIGEKEVFD
jgi:uncharacterized radical SAM protein YgiQ